MKKITNAQFKIFNKLIDIIILALTYAKKSKEASNSEHVHLHLHKIDRELYKILAVECNEESGKEKGNKIKDYCGNKQIEDYFSDHWIQFGDKIREGISNSNPGRALICYAVAVCKRVEEGEPNKVTKELKTIIETFEWVRYIKGSGKKRNFDKTSDKLKKIKTISDHISEKFKSPKISASTSVVPNPPQKLQEAPTSSQAQKINHTGPVAHQNSLPIPPQIPPTLIVGGRRSKFLRRHSEAVVPQSIPPRNRGNERRLSEYQLNGDRVTRQKSMCKSSFFAEGDKQDVRQDSDGPIAGQDDQRQQPSDCERTCHWLEALK